MSTLFVLLGQAATKTQDLEAVVRKVIQENPLTKSYDVLLQTGAIGACLVIFVILYIAGLRYQQRLHKETVALVKADTDQTRVAYQEMIRIHERNEDKMEKLLERYHNDLAEISSTLDMALTKLGDR